MGCGMVEKAGMIKTNPQQDLKYCRGVVILMGEAKKLLPIGQV